MRSRERTLFQPDSQCPYRRFLPGLVSVLGAVPEMHLADCFLIRSFYTDVDCQ